MTVDAVIAELNGISDRAELVAFLTLLRLPPNLNGPGRARVTAALIAAASRCWKRTSRRHG
jgi:hypothetical protein